MVQNRLFPVWTFENGKVIRHRVFNDRDEALVARTTPSGRRVSPERVFKITSVNVSIRPPGAPTRFSRARLNRGTAPRIDISAALARTSCSCAPLRPAVVNRRAGIQSGWATSIDGYPNLPKYCSCPTDGAATEAAGLRR